MVKRLGDFFDRHLIHDDIDDGAIARFGRLGFPDFPDNIHAFSDFPEDGVPPVEVWCRCERNEELAAVRIREG